MSKAFNSINWSKLVDYLQSAIEADELHIIFKLLNVSQMWKCPEWSFWNWHWSTTRRLYKRTWVYKAIRWNIAGNLTKQNYGVVTQEDQSDIEMEYAVDISKLTSNHNSIESSKHHLIEVLESRDLMIDKDRTKSTW